jgi:hypothetical protein
VALSPEAVISLAADLIASHSRDALERDGRLSRVNRYLTGKHDLPYMPRGAKAEYRSIAERSITNWTGLVLDTFAKALFVDGYRPANAVENARPWSIWQANRMDARQSTAIRGALAFGTSYALVLPGDDGVPLIRPLSPLRSYAFYEDLDDEWPVVAMLHKGTTRGGARYFQIFDDEAVYDLVLERDKDRPEFVSMSSHGLGVTPFVRFRESLDVESRGIIEPIIPVQDRINEAVFSMMVAIQFASFRQRWATGLAIPIDEDPNSATFGQPVEPFKAAVDRLWVTDNPEAKFGDFAQTDVSGHLRAYESAVRSLAAIAQTPPHVLTGDLVNLSADALAAIEQSTQRKIGEYETVFGESWEQVLRLAAAASGDAEAASDVSAQVRWRDTEARSLAQTVDALVKMSTIGVPAEALWERIPGVTDQDVQRWRSLRAEGDVFGSLVSEIQRQAQTEEQA